VCRSGSTTDDTRSTGASSENPGSEGLVTRAVVPGIGAEEFDQISKDAKAGCPVSKALKGNVNITLKATLAR